MAEVSTRISRRDAIKLFAYAGAGVAAGGLFLRDVVEMDSNEKRVDALLRNDNSYTNLLDYNGKLPKAPDGVKAILAEEKKEYYNNTYRRIAGISTAMIALRSMVEFSISFTALAVAATEFMRRWKSEIEPTTE